MAMSSVVHTGPSRASDDDSPTFVVHLRTSGTSELGAGDDIATAENERAPEASIDTPVEAAPATSQAPASEDQLGAQSWSLLALEREMDLDAYGEIAAAPPPSSDQVVENAPISAAIPPAPRVPESQIDSSVLLPEAPVIARSEEVPVQPAASSAASNALASGTVPADVGRAGPDTKDGADRSAAGTGADSPARGSSSTSGDDAGALAGRAGSATVSGGSAAVLLFGPHPEYPPASIRRGEEGRVLCCLHVGKDGGVHAVDVLQSSGHARLDQAATDALLRWRFQPATEGGHCVPFRLSHPVTFVLK